MKPHVIYGSKHQFCYKMSATEILDLNEMLAEIESFYKGADPAHDISHIMRVYRNARIIGRWEGADMQVLLLAALLHDLGREKKLINKSERTFAQGLEMADDFLKRMGVAEEIANKVLYSIEVHSFSKGIVPEILEARILQDADRLDAIGAIGIARVFAMGGAMGRSLYSSKDPLCKTRPPDDERWDLDHFFSKLLKLESGMHTAAAKKMARTRTAVLRRFLCDISQEMGKR